MDLHWPWRRWQEARRARGGPHAALFEPATGSEWIALDLETTGLDPSKDQILSIAAVPCSGNRILLSRRLDIVVQCRSQRIPDAIRYHRLRPSDVAAGVPLDEALDRLLAMIGSRPLLGYCIGFDIAMLDAVLRPRFGFGLPNRPIDVQREYAAWVRRRDPLAAPDLRFDAIAAALGIPPGQRHRALDDAIAAALMHLRMTR
jgi:DNA polymerase III subunit epsilon